MAWDINKVVLVGRLAGDIELRYTPSGTAVGKFSLAVGGRPRDGKETVSFFNVVVWGKMAENCNSYVSKGSRIALDGRIEQRTWTTNEGSRRSVVEIIAERIEFLTTKGEANSNTNASMENKPSNTNDSAPSGEDAYYNNSTYDPTPLNYSSDDTDEVPY